MTPREQQRLVIGSTGAIQLLSIEIDRLSDMADELHIKAAERQDYINQLEQKAMQAFEENEKIIAALKARIAELEPSK